MRSNLPITVILLILCTCFLSCKNLNKAAAENPGETATDTIVVLVEKPLQPRDSLLLSFEKGACFGKCPIYKVKVYDTGYATYEGINFTKLLGNYSAQFAQEELLEIYNEAESIGYFELESNYDDPFISDLPSTKSRIQFQGKSHRITARANVPEKLKEFHENLSVRLLERNWVANSED